MRTLNVIKSYGKQAKPASFMEDDHSESSQKPESYYIYARPEVLAMVPKTAQRVLDIGCGAGGFSATLKARQTVEIHGVEMFAEAAQNARSHVDKVWNNTIEEALPDLPDAYYDCIVVADVLEHLQDPWSVLTTLKSKLVADGVLVASIPNIQNWGVLSELIEGKWDYRSEGILDRTHLRFFTRKSVEELFWTAGFYISCIDTTRRGPEPPKTLFKSFAKAGLSFRELDQDGRTWQFLIEAKLPKAMASPTVYIVLLNWNGRTDTVECLESLLQLEYPNYKVIVVDNGSTDGSVETISNLFPGISLLRNGKNIGYAGGNNVGIQWALEHGANYILILNNDTTVHPELVEHLIRVASLDPTIGLLGPANYYYSKPTTIWTVGAMMGRPPHSGFVTIGEGDPDGFWKTTTQFDALVGSAILIRRDVIEKIGLFDERFFLCYEEFDLSVRAREAGYKCLFVPEAKIWHKVGSALGVEDSPLRTYFNTRNRLLWSRKHLSRSSRNELIKESFQTVRKILLPTLHFTKTEFSVFKTILWSFSSWLKTIKRNLANPVNKAKLLGIRDYYLGRFGDCPESVREL